MTRFEHLVVPTDAGRMRAAIGHAQGTVASGAAGDRASRPSSCDSLADAGARGWGRVAVHAVVDQADTRFFKRSCQA